MIMRLARILLLSYLGLGALLYFAQDSFMYLPSTAVESSSIAFETLQADEVSLKVWRVNPGQSRALLYFGGNAENVYYSALDYAAQLPDYTVYLLNYRGYGGSTGKPSEQALFDDARLLFDQYQQQHDSLVVMGRSLGSGVATYLASVRPVSRLILATPFDSALALAKDLYPFFPVSLMMRDHYNSLAYAGEVNAPTLLLLAGDDRQIPRDHSLRLAEAFAPQQAELATVEGANHNNLSGRAEYWQAIRRFLDAESVAEKN